MFSSVRNNDKVISILWDSGSNITIITHRMAQKLGLRDRNVKLGITRVGTGLESLKANRRMLQEAYIK